MNTSQFFGRSTEYRVSSMLLDEHRELYLPAVDDHGVDMIVRTRAACAGDGTRPEHYEFQEIQVKSASSGGLFAAIRCDNPRPNYWFVFFIKDIDSLWLVNSLDFVRIASQNVKGKNIGKYTLDLKPTSRTPIKQPQFFIKDFTKLP